MTMRVFHKNNRKQVVTKGSIPQQVISAPVKAVVPNHTGNNKNDFVRSRIAAEFDGYQITSQDAEYITPDIINKKNPLKLLLKYLAYKTFCNKYFKLPDKDEEYEDVISEKISYKNLLKKWGINTKSSTRYKLLYLYIKGEYPYLCISHIWNIAYLFYHPGNSFDEFKTSLTCPLLKEYEKIMCSSLFIEDTQEKKCLDEFRKLSKDIIAIFPKISRFTFWQITSELARDLRSIYLHNRPIDRTETERGTVELAIHAQDYKKFINIADPLFMKIPLNMTEIPMNSWSDINKPGHKYLDTHQWISVLGLEILPNDNIKLKDFTIQSHESMINHTYTKPNVMTCGMNHIIIGAAIANYIKKIKNRTSSNTYHWNLKLYDSGWSKDVTFDSIIKKSKEPKDTINKKLNITMPPIPVINDYLRMSYIFSTIIDPIMQLEYLTAFLEQNTITREVMGIFKKHINGIPILSSSEANQLYNKSNKSYTINRFRGRRRRY